MGWIVIDIKVAELDWLMVNEVIRRLTGWKCSISRYYIIIQSTV